MRNRRPIRQQPKAIAIAATAKPFTLADAMTWALPLLAMLLLLH